MAFKIECLQAQGILHTYFESNTAVNSHEEVRRLRDRLLHARLECPTDPVWVLSLDNLDVSDQWLAALGNLFHSLRSEGVKGMVAYTDQPALLHLWEKRFELEMHLTPETIPVLLNSRDEAFQCAVERLKAS